MATNFYVYYRILPGREATARAGVLELLRRLLLETGVQGRLLAKRGEAGLWMEVYEDVSKVAEFERALETQAAAAGLDQCLVDGKRHVECFVPCA